MNSKYGNCVLAKTINYWYTRGRILVDFLVIGRRKNSVYVVLYFFANLQYTINKYNHNLVPIRAHVHFVNCIVNVEQKGRILSSLQYKNFLSAEILHKG